MSYWKTSQIVKAAEFWRLATAAAGLSGDYAPTGATNLNAPVYRCEDTGLYLFLCYSDDMIMDQQWVLTTAAPTSYLGATTWDDDYTSFATTYAAPFWKLSTTASDLTDEDEALANATGCTYYAADGTAGDTATIALSHPVLPFLDSSVDGYGVPTRESAVCKWKVGKLCYQRITATYSAFSLYEAYTKWLAGGGADAARTAAATTYVYNSAYPDGYNADNASSRWQGQVYIPEAGEWSISYLHDDAGYLRIGETVLGSSASTTTTGTATLAEGWQELDIILSDIGGEYRNKATLTAPSGTVTELGNFTFRVNAATLKGAGADYAYAE